MDKKKLIQEIFQQLEKNLSDLKAAALKAHEAATAEESRAENQYDTRALEASYLAGAQAKRVQELETALNVFRFLKTRSFNDATPIDATALVELDSEGRRSFVFIVPTAGGLLIQQNSKSIQVLTPKSPLGEALLGLKKGDVAIVEKSGKTLEYEIISVA